MRCPSEAFKAYWLHRRNEGSPPPAIAYGSGWHACMEAHYKAHECSEADLLDAVLMNLSKTWEDHGIADEYRTAERCFLEYKKYLRKFGLPWREEAKTIGWPETPFVEMSGEVSIPGARHPYAYKIDRMARLQQQHIIDDHKTSSREEKTYFKQYHLDNQMMGYAVSGSILSGRIITGVRIRRHVVRTSDSVHDHETIPFSEPRLEAWCRNYEIWLSRMEHDLQQYETIMKETGDQRLAMDTAFPLNKWACFGRKYSGCTFVAQCSYPEHLRLRALEEDYGINVWNPLEAKGEGEDA